ncbi:MAG TPA: 3-deoxy-manno-octulosonate cytidylyltransferase, partial [Leptospiraceae bacterium]|nr:3-deoxy-manno-octulosonate cytidylyltransferase [Leptospiraceae bacterium]
MKVLGVIPARYGSQRFPGKVIAPLGKKPMVQWVYEAASRCKDLDHLVIATDDERV